MKVDVKDFIILPIELYKTDEEGNIVDTKISEAYIRKSSINSIFRLDNDKALVVSEGYHNHAYTSLSYEDTLIELFNQ